MTTSKLYPFQQKIIEYVDTLPLLRYFREILCMLDIKRRFGQHSTIVTNANERIRIARQRLKKLRKLKGGV